MDGLDLTARMMSTNVPRDPTIVQLMPLATTPTVATNVHVVLDMKEMEESVAMDVQVIISKDEAL